MFPNDKLENWDKGKGHWNDIPDHLWYDWKWQMRNCLKSKDDFLNFMDLTEDELVGFDIANNKLSVAVTQATQATVSLGPWPGRHAHCRPLGPLLAGPLLRS